MKNNLKDNYKYFLKAKVKKKVEIILGFFLCLIIVFNGLELIKNIFYLMKIKPIMMDLEVLPLILFFNVFYLNLIVLVICVGFVFIYLAIKNRRYK